MKNKLIMLLLVFVPVFMYGQRHVFQHNFEFQAGYAAKDKCEGSAIDLRYALGITDQIDALVSIGNMHGTDHNRSNYTTVRNLVHNTFSSTSARIGLRGSIHFLKIGALKLSALCGYSYKTESLVCEVPEKPYTLGKFGFCYGGTGELNFKITPLVSMGWYYNQMRITGPHAANVFSTGLTMSFVIGSPRRL